MSSKKQKTIFVCQECGYESPKWMGQCICGQWNTFVEEKIQENTNNVKGRMPANSSKPVPIREIRSGIYDRLDTGIAELNRVLGGGLVKGSVILISGEPGIGKSTLILQAAAAIAGKNGKVLYISGEESEEQIKIRADRIGALSEELYLLSETNVDRILDFVHEIQPVFLIIDSIQTLFSQDLSSAPGSVSQVRECANYILREAKAKNIPVFIIAHVTKSGDLAGPRILEHMVDAVLNFTGERNQEFRMLRSYKNRYGTTSEIGAFEMKESGLMELDNLSRSFLEGLEKEAEGAMVTCSYEGTRPLLLEVQALAVPANIGFARRTSIGFDNGRLNMIIAVLEKKTGVSFINKDIYINIVGGIKPEGTSVDLAVALAIYSSCKGIKIPSCEMIAFGEIGLTGELRPVPNADKMLKEASRMGFKKVILPDKNAKKNPEKLPGTEVLGISTLLDAIKILENQ